MCDSREGFRFMKYRIEGKRLDEERALYHLEDAEVADCSFAGPADGESALKEAVFIRVLNCRFELRYPLWHVKEFYLENTVMTETSRAALWYADDGRIFDCTLNGVKAVRECSDVHLRGCTIESAEFGWKSRDILLEDSDITAEYLFLDSRDVKLRNVRMHGKYSFQYMENLEITDSVLDTKDAFWHSKNVTVRNSVIRSEYLGWFSEGLTLENCEISGTQPLCYCKDLKLINCSMQGCDLSFEYSDVEADIRGGIDSVKNPRSGIIVADHVGEVISGDAVMECTGEVRIRAEQTKNI